MSIQKAVFNIARTALVVQGLSTQNYGLLARATQDRLHEAARAKSIPGYQEAVNEALDHGAAAVTISGGGPALLAFASTNHHEIAMAMGDAFRKAAGVETSFWVLPIETHGISISETDADFGAQRKSPTPASSYPVEGMPIGAGAQPTPDAHSTTTPSGTDALSNQEHERRPLSLREAVQRLDQATGHKGK